MSARAIQKRALSHSFLFKLLKVAILHCDIPPPLLQNEKVCYDILGVIHILLYDLGTSLSSMWVTFPRTGIFTQMCHLKKRSRAFVAFQLYLPKCVPCTIETISFDLGTHF